MGMRVDEQRPRRSILNCRTYAESANRMQAANKSFQMRRVGREVRYALGLSIEAASSRCRPPPPSRQDTNDVLRYEGTHPNRSNNCAALESFASKR